MISLSCDHHHHQDHCNRQNHHTQKITKHYLFQTRCPGGRGGGGGGGGGHGNRQLALVELPAELLIKILEYMTFKVILMMMVLMMILVLFELPAELLIKILEYMPSMSS